jgi:BirA family biotin operon repressor/biotin-[acetyl-CoA-carboxylase] ligase
LTVKDDLPLDVGPLRERLVRDGRLVDWEHHETIDSTNRRAAVVGREGIAGPVLVTAEHQSAGRGRQGRVWESPAHRNFYGSFVLCPKVAQAELAPITLVAALAVSDAIAGIGLSDAAIKWPNDVLLGGRKVAGILTELDSSANGEFCVVVGIGVNLNLQEGDFPPELRSKAGSLAWHGGRSVDRSDFVDSLTQAFLGRVHAFEQQGFAGLRADYEQRHALQGEVVRVDGGEGCTGRVLGVDDAGALLLATAQGQQAIHAGEVTLASSYETLGGAVSKN